MNGTNEIWRPITGYALYSISNLGRVRSDNLYSHKEPLIMKLSLDKDGHLKVRLSKDGKVTNCSVHRLVATAFIANPDGLPLVNHKDENPANNCVDNLEWCTHRENTIHNNMTKRRAKALKRPIWQITPLGHKVRLWGCRADIEREKGVSGGNITLACQGKREFAYGYRWEYAEKEAF